ncbi:MAG: pectate lyase, partial [Promicromonosporaceae bacterium]|nr:pectate lyase [Promicromonosporaceae bacterium]
GTSAGITEMSASRNVGNPDSPNPDDREHPSVGYMGRGITSHEIRFMLQMYEATGIQRFLDSAELGLEALWDAQYEAGDIVVLAEEGQTLESDTSEPKFVVQEDLIAVVDQGAGGWPYYISEQEMHRGAVSFNDDGYNYAIELMLDIAEGEFPDLPAAYIERARQSFVAALEAIIRLQIRSDAFADGIERPTAWTQHFNPETGDPMWGREFEPPAINGGEESRDLFIFLTSLDLDLIESLGGAELRQELIDSIHYAAYWFAYVEITGYQQVGAEIIENPAAGGLWARYYNPDDFQVWLVGRRTEVTDPEDDPFGIWDMQEAIAATPPAGIDRSVYFCTAANDCEGDPTRFQIDGAWYTLNPAYGEFDLVHTYASLSLERRTGYGFFRPGAGLTVARAYSEWLARNGIDVAVQSIGHVTDAVRTGVPTPIMASVEPAQANHTEITWSIVSDGGTGATLSGNVLTAPRTGTVTLEAKVVDGLLDDGDYTHAFEVQVVDHLPVDYVIGAPTFLPIGTISLDSIQILPAAAADNTDIVWRVANAGGTGATISGQTLTTSAPGDVTLEATIPNGAAPGEDFSATVTIRIDQDPEEQVVIDDAASAVITDLSVLELLNDVQSSGVDNWEYLRDFQVGNDLYGDRAQGGNFRVSEAPDWMLGASWIRTSQDARNQANDPRTQAIFTIQQPTWVVVGFEQRTDLSLVHWIDSSWTFLGEDVYFRSSEAANNNPRYYLYAKYFEAGEVFRFGGLNQGTGLGNAVVFFVDEVPGLS